MSSSTHHAEGWGLAPDRAGFGGLLLRRQSHALTTRARPNVSFVLLAVRCPRGVIGDVSPSDRLCQCQDPHPAPVQPYRLRFLGRWTPSVLPPQISPQTFAARHSTFRLECATRGLRVALQDDDESRQHDEARDEIDGDNNFERHD
jgi:hypothetical protein